MLPKTSFLIFSAVSVGVVHTLMGPDHYIPFVMMAKARKWGSAKVCALTAVCGAGHVLSSVGLGLLGGVFGVALGKIVAIQSLRGEIAAWGLVAFGLVYMTWGVRRAARKKMHSHIHHHLDGNGHAHEHTHLEDHVHIHEGREALTPWIIFTIFVFGPCESLIPFVFSPAVRGDAFTFFLVIAAFSIATIGTMIASVLALLHGLNILPLSRFERYTHAFAGAAILLCGLASILFGL